MASLLLIEDDPILGEGLKLNLGLEGFQVQWAKNLQSAFDCHAQQSYDLAILDLGLPDGNGLMFCKTVRDQGARLPIIVLTAKLDEDSVVDALSCGADDYVRKPFGNRELVARIKVCLNQKQMRGSKMKWGDLVIHGDQRKVLYSNIEIPLNRKEFDILQIFSQRIDNVVSREFIISKLKKCEDINDRYHRLPYQSYSIKN